MDWIPITSLERWKGCRHMYHMSHTVGPDASMTSAAENSLKGSQLSLTKHYMTCEGGNPLIECKPKIVLPVMSWTLSLIIIIASHRF